MTGAPPAIEASGLVKRFGRLTAVDRLDLVVPAGSIFGLLGPNGAGKTTTIRLLTGLARADAGSATVAGAAIGSGDGLQLRRRIGVLDQDPRFYGWMTGRELLTLAGRLLGLDGRALRDRVEETLGRVGLADSAGRRVGGYSGGMRQRLGIGQALVGQPSLLILDEPVSSLDPEGRRDLLELIRGLRDAATVLLSTHVLSDVERVCDRVAILDHGRLVTESSIEALLEDHARPIYRVEPEPGQDGAVAHLVAGLRASSWVTNVDQVPGGELRIGVSDGHRAATELLPAIVAAGVRVVAVERARPTLEDVFLHLVGSAREPVA
jgi:ABC-2 type transport system ATP-binding protein